MLLMPLKVLSSTQADICCVSSCNAEAANRWLACWLLVAVAWFAELHLWGAVVSRPADAGGSSACNGQLHRPSPLGFTVRTAPRVCLPLHVPVRVCEARCVADSQPRTVLGLALPGLPGRRKRRSGSAIRGKRISSMRQNVSSWRMKCSRVHRTVPYSVVCGCNVVAFPERRVQARPL
jgi:hypothetical protein